MPVRPPLRASVSRHAEKEQNIKQFVVRHIAGHASDAGNGHLFDLQIVARSLGSPLIKAITSLGDDIAAAGLSVRIILARLDRELNPETWAQSVAFAHEIRWAKHPRLIEAHEQLVLGPETCWIGDCMRRDPAKCDAYESFIEGCGEAAGCAAVSFERLWLASQAIAGASRGGIGAFRAPPARADGPQATIGTRH